MDYTGAVVNNFKVLARLPQSYWEVVCLGCNNPRQLRTNQLTNPEKYSFHCEHCENNTKPKQDLIGKKFGSLSVVQYVPKFKHVKKSNGKMQWMGAWECVCDCGNKLVVLTNRLINLKTTSCGCLHKNKIIDLTGKSFGKLKVIRLESSKNNKRIWSCQCGCGEIRLVPTDKLVSGKQVSCGCSRKEYKPSALRVENRLKAFKRQRENTFTEIVRFSKERGLEVLTKVEDFVKFESSHRDHITFRCEAKGHAFQIAWFNLKTVHHCRQCFQFKSKPEQDMREFILYLVGSDKVLPNVKNLVPGVNEVDIYLPDHKLAVEHNGLFWHSLGEKDRHLKKRELLREAGITCIQINGDEWENKRPIVESMLRARLGLSPHKLNARDLTVYNPTPEESRKFVEENHLMGAFRAAKALGLKTKAGELVCLITYRIEGGSMEISRMCSKLNYQVVGGVSRLLAHLPIEGIKELVSFVDLRYATGHSLERLGFSLAGITLGWKWTDGAHSYNRLACRANMDERKLSEVEYAAELKWRKIYDAGQAKFIKKLG